MSSGSPDSRGGIDQAGEGRCREGWGWQASRGALDGAHDGRAEACRGNTVQWTEGRQENKASERVARVSKHPGRRGGGKG